MDKDRLSATSPDDLSQERLDRLSRRDGSRAIYSTKYSVFIRRMRIALPLLAGFIVALLFAWNALHNEKSIITVTEADMPKTTRKNELVEPRFESVDDKDQPYTVTAARAIQSDKDENLVILEKPVADILLNEGAWVALRADQGAFRQDTRRLLLKGHVELFHDRGYQMETDRLQINIEERTAHSKSDIYIYGPEGTLNAKGLQADVERDLLVFTGPARLVLTRSPGLLSGEGESL